MADLTQEDIDAQIAAVREEMRAELKAQETRHQQELADAKAGPPNPGHNIRENGAGPGLDIRPTWSQFEQELAVAGNWQEPEAD